MARINPNMAQRSGIKSHLKHLVLPPGNAPRTIRAGLLAGLHMDIDFANHAQLWLGLEERELLSWFRTLSDGICTAIDVGANVGIYTLYFLAKTAAEKVLVFEPSRQNLLSLERNLALNQLTSDHRLEIVQKFVGSHTAKEWVALDIFSEGIAKPCLVKVDVDGGEVELLRGAERVLHSPQVRWIIEVHSKELEEQCLTILQEARYRVILVRNAWWRYFLPEMRPIELNRWLVAVPAGL